MTITHFKALKVVPYSILEDEMTNIDSQQLTQCLELLREYSSQMRNHQVKGHLDEVKYVQPHSLSLIQGLFKVMIPDHYRDLVFIAGEAVDTRYHTSIQLDRNKWVDVKGRSDISVLYKTICIFTWEDKRLDKLLNTIEEMCQITVEVKGFAEEFKRVLGVEARRFCGVETSGLIWSFCTRKYRNG